jgi:hypothetical protein
MLRFDPRVVSGEEVKDLTTEGTEDHRETGVS